MVTAMRQGLFASFLAVAILAVGCGSTITSAPAPTAVVTPAKSDLERAAETLLVTPRSASVVPPDTARRINNAALATTFECRNTGRKDVRAFTGLLTYLDISGRTIKQVPLKWDTPVAAGATPTDFEDSFVLNRFDDDDKTLRDTPVERLQIRFELQSVIYADGTYVGPLP